MPQQQQQDHRDRRRRSSPIIDHVLNILLRPSTGWWSSGMNWIRQKFWNFLYQVASQKNSKDQQWQFINYGYVPEDGKLISLPNRNDHDGTSNAYDKCGQTCIQLYHEVVRAVPILGKNVVEIGSGRGGGASYIAQVMEPKMMIGIELCQASVDFANATTKHISNVHFQQGDAMNIPLPDNVYDVVVNVESSHCYPNFQLFMKEVYRILKPGGYVVLCDMRVTTHIPVMEADMEQCGFTIQVNQDITSNVLQSMKLCSTTRLALMKDTFGCYNILKLFFDAFAGLEGSIMYQHYQEGLVQYKRYVLQKPELDNKK
jgi:ubiquinone/menaquinone biosynthesis C-methylase UbiE